MLCLTPKGVGNLICPIRDSLSCNYYSSDNLSSGMHVIVDLQWFHIQEGRNVNACK